MSVGTPNFRFDAVDKVTGRAQYPADRAPADALVAKVVFTGEPHARLVDLDTRQAEAVDGVIAVLTAADVPCNEYGLTKFDQPVLVGPTDTDSVAVPTNVSRWEADHLAVVIARDSDAAQRGAQAIRATWKRLPLVNSLAAALGDDVLVHPEEKTNSYHRLRLRKGDPQLAARSSDVVVEGKYHLPHQEHAYLQPEAATGWVDDHGRITVEIAGQWTHEDREQIAHALAIPEDEVRVIYPAIGGAFGGREDMSLQIVVALAAQKVAALGLSNRVHCRWSREESIVGHHKRHAAQISVRLRADAEGKIRLLEADILLDAGGYNYTSNKVLGNAHLSVAGPYEVPNARIDSTAVYTTNPPGGAFRGFGGPQGAFAIEMQMNRLAEALQLDPVELRRRNLLTEQSIGITGVSPPQGVTIAGVLDACVEQAAMSPEREPNLNSKSDPERLFSPFASLAGDQAAVARGRGIACGLKNVGFSFGFPERSEAKIVLHGDREDPESAELFHAGAEVGQGSHQAFLQMAAEAIGLPLDRVSGRFSDTATSGDSGSASASRLTFMAGNSILGAAEVAQKAWLDGDRPAVGEFRYVPPPTDELDAVGFGQPNFVYGYMATAAEVSVDTESGHIRVERIVAAHDVGRAINPQLVKGQVEGCVAQAHGYVLSEDLKVIDGCVQNPRLSMYLIPGIGDIPLIVEMVLLESGNHLGPFGAIGVAEMPFITYAPAVLAAVHDATGVWFDRFPLTPSTVIERITADSG